MSLLRVCALAKCASRRGLFRSGAVRVSPADRCRLFVSTRDGGIRRISETPLQLQRRNVSIMIPKRDDAKKRVVEQSQLLDVLKARIQQLQPDVVLDVHHANVQFVKGPSPGRGPKVAPKEKTDIPKSAKTLKAASKSKTSRWMEKLTREEKNKLTKAERLPQKIQKNVKEKPSAKSKGSKSSSALPGTSHKVVPNAAPLAKSRARTKLSDEIRAAVSSTEASRKLGPAKEGRRQTEDWGGAEELEKGRWTLSSNPQPPPAKEEGGGEEDGAAAASCGDVQLSIRSYLEACVFAGDVERAHRFLLSQHRVRSRRKLLNTDVYNIMMRVWAKKGTLNQIGRIFILLEEAGLKPNLGSYCTALECMGRNPDCQPKLITRCLSQMEEDGLSVDDLLGRCVFRQDERDMVLKAVRLARPDYEPRLRAGAAQCPSLVQEFYAQVPLEQSSFILHSLVSLLHRRPDTVKQKNAFPPNFIHSLDSTHMMLTALHCYSAGLTFVSVHDCFWTHALTVDTMNQICREQFVALHSQPILRELSEFLLQKYCTGLPAEAKNKKYQEYRRLMLLLAKVPQTGDFDLQRVKESTYFFS
ncbi:DNA-directed RNA polymerase, mitochondrial [Pungitius pungitius]|uniref:DNA-directed RNA polymerase, mitochondrial n=1 Tax=Pungitius pungitius TaxID=134920 RepID=UPI002E1022F4